MKWSEFSSLLAGIDSKTALGRIVSIRSEEDPEVLKYFSKQEHKIRNDWRNKQAKKVSEKELNEALELMKNAFIAMAGGGGEQ